MRQWNIILGVLKKIDGLIFVIFIIKEDFSMNSRNCSCDGILSVGVIYSYTSSYIVLVGPDDTALHTFGKEGECLVEFDKKARTLIVADSKSILAFRYKIPDHGELFSWDDHIHFMGHIRHFICKKISRRAHKRVLIVNTLEFDSNVLTIDHEKGRSRVSLSFGSGRKGEYMRVENVELLD
jgi:hypothetical protein